MPKRIRSHTAERLVTRIRRKARITKKRLAQSKSTSRLVVFRSNKYLYAQVVDDQKRQTMVQANTREEEFKPMKSKKNLAAGKALGLLIGRRASEQKIDTVFFDRNGYDYHGRIKAIADGAREAGLKF